MRWPAQGEAALGIAVSTCGSAELDIYLERVEKDANREMKVAPKGPFAMNHKDTDHAKRAMA